MIDRVTAVVTIAEGETSGTAKTRYTSGLVEAVYVWAVTEAESPQLELEANEEPYNDSREIASAGIPIGDGGAVAYPRIQINEDPLILDKVPVYGTIQVPIQSAEPGDVFNVVIYLSNSNPNGH